MMLKTLAYKIEIEMFVLKISWFVLKMIRWFVLKMIRLLDCQPRKVKLSKVKLISLKMKDER